MCQLIQVLLKHLASGVQYTAWSEQEIRPNWALDKHLFKFDVQAFVCAMSILWMQIPVTQLSVCSCDVLYMDETQQLQIVYLCDKCNGRCTCLYTRIPFYP